MAKFLEIVERHHSAWSFRSKSQQLLQLSLRLKTFTPARRS
ncbi:MAG: hypothetical protein V7K61_31620 [Nostoc sp.]